MIQAVIEREGDFIKWPTFPELRATADPFFEVHGLPNICQGVDGNVYICCQVELTSAVWFDSPLLYVVVN